MFCFSYPAHLTRDEEKRVLVTFPDFPRIATDGEDLAEALSEASDCLGSEITFRMIDREDIPPPSVLRRGQRLIPVPLHLAPKLALYLAMREQGVNNSVMARRLGVTEAVVRRLLDPRHDSKPEKVQAALAELGKRIVVSVEAA
jgi:antitoxin HicB